MGEAARIDQELARVAHEILPETVSRELRTRMRQLPARLRGGGLASTYAFILAKADPNPREPLGYAYHLLAQRIATHAASRNLLEGAPAQMTPRRFLEKLSQATPGEYARLSAEIDALAVWLARLAEAYYQPDPPQGGDEHGQDAPQTPHA